MTDGGQARKSTTLPSTFLLPSPNIAPAAESGSAVPERPGEGRRPVVTPQFSGDADPPRGGALHAGCPRIKSSDSQQHTWGYVCGMEPCKYLQPVPSAKGDSISKFHIRISESRKQLKILAILARSQIPEPGGDSHLAARTSRCLPACIGARQSNSLKPRGALEQDTQNRAKPHPPPNSNQRISQQ